MRVFDFLSLSEWCDGLSVVAVIPCCMIIGWRCGFGRSTLITLSGLLAFFTAVCGVIAVQDAVHLSVGLSSTSRSVMRVVLPGASFVVIVIFVWAVLGSIALSKVVVVGRKVNWAFDRIGGGLMGCCGGIVVAASLQCALMLGMASFEAPALPASRQMAAASLLIKSYSHYMGADYEQTLRRFLASGAGSMNKKTK